MRTRKNILYSTFIGLKVQIINSSQQDLLGLEGVIVDETKNILFLENSSKEVLKIPKISSTFRFTLDDKSTIDIAGKTICFRPHERPKKVKS